MKYKYKVIYGNGGSLREECGNNKTQLIKWANESYLRASVYDLSTGEVIHENAAQRKAKAGRAKFQQIVSRLKAGEPLASVVDLQHYE